MFSELAGLDVQFENSEPNDERAAASLLHWARAFCGSILASNWSPAPTESPMTSGANSPVFKRLRCAAAFEAQMTGTCIEVRARSGHLARVGVAMDPRLLL